MKNALTSVSCGIALLIILSLVVPVSFAADTSQAPPVPREQQLLSKFAGNWNMSVALTNPDGSKAACKGTCTIVPIANGFYGTDLMTLKGVGPMEEHDLIAYDANTGKVHMMSVTSMGEVHDHVGAWKDDNTLVFQWKGLYEKKQTTEDITFKFDGTDHIITDDAYTTDGKPNGSGRYDMTRAK